MLFQKFLETKAILVDSLGVIIGWLGINSLAIKYFQPFNTKFWGWS